MSVAIVKSRECNVNDLVKRSPVDGIYDAHLLLKRWLKKSEEVWLGMHDGQVACVWGLSLPTIISDKVHMWLFVTDLVEQHKFTFVRKSQMVVQDALKTYPIITGHVVAKNYAAKRWLRWLGADIGPPEEGVCKFVIRRKA